MVNPPLDRNGLFYAFGLRALCNSIYWWFHIRLGWRSLSNQRFFRNQTMKTMRYGRGRGQWWRAFYVAD